jgi:hypothetical protein
LSLEFPSSVGVGQGSALFPILWVLCLAPLLKKFEHRVCLAVLISYVDDSTIILQSDTWGKNLVKLKLAYKIMFELTQSMGLVLEHSKLEGFHFSRKHSDSNPDIDLGYAPYTSGSWRNRMSNWDFIHSNRLIVQTLTSTAALTYLSLPGDAQLVDCWCQRLSSILLRGSSNLQR